MHTEFDGWVLAGLVFCSLGVLTYVGFCFACVVDAPSYRDLPWQAVPGVLALPTILGFVVLRSLYAAAVWAWVQLIAGGG